MNNLYQKPLSKKALFAGLYPLIQIITICIVRFTPLLDLFELKSQEEMGSFYSAMFLVYLVGNIVAITFAFKERDRYKTSHIFPILMNLASICFMLLPIAALAFMYLFVPLD